ncbi:hypothetical protein CLAVI_000987 [Candidatus Clavichlamydia salmonicola]|uniref:hypothetical protein n=1 Tax=Candidatus Clavichlamydia salmonicola TaxID=469812 RepID=UPI001891C53B|nr:hypothetical protein [Candidatus Clavichlamydia salmonicola]MBF5051344.1 hypothetical protein [Candidatus Clavichlamydia salmonicola]
MPEEVVMLEMGILKKSKDVVELQECAFFRFDKIMQKMDTLKNSVRKKRITEVVQYSF